MTRRIRMIVQYDGTAYAGWQTQPNGLAVQERLEQELYKITGEAIRLHASGRTDSGVHARAQVAHFDTQSRIPGPKFAYALNCGLPRQVRLCPQLRPAPGYPGGLQPGRPGGFPRPLPGGAQALPLRPLAKPPWEPLSAGYRPAYPPSPGSRPAGTGCGHGGGGTRLRGLQGRRHYPQDHLAHRVRVVRVPVGPGGMPRAIVLPCGGQRLPL